MKLDLTPEQLKTVEIALCELFNSDTWISGRKEADIDTIADRAQYLLNIIETHNKTEKLFTLNPDR
jgi:hypothetical protein